MVRRFLFLCSIRQTKLYYGPYNSKKRLMTTLAVNISLALRRLTCMLDTLFWSCGGRNPSDKWLWNLLRSGLRKFRRVSVKAGLYDCDVEWIGLSCLQLEVKRSSEFTARLRDIIKKTKNKFRMNVKHQEYFDAIISSAHNIVKFKSVVAKNGYKTIKLN